MQDGQAAGLADPSVLKPLTASLEKNQIVKCLGQLAPSTGSGWPAYWTA